MAGVGSRLRRETAGLATLVRGTVGSEVAAFRKAAHCKIRLVAWIGENVRHDFAGSEGEMVDPMSRDPGIPEDPDHLQTASSWMTSLQRRPTGESDLG